MREHQYFFFASCLKKKAEYEVADRRELFEWKWNYLGEESIGIVLFCLQDIIINNQNLTPSQKSGDHLPGLGRHLVDFCTSALVLSLVPH